MAIGGSRFYDQNPKAALSIVLSGVCLFTIAWLWLSLAEKEMESSFLGAFGSAAGVAGYCFFSLSLFLASRLKLLEDWIGGLDQIYRLHHRLGLWGFYILLLHPFIFAFKWFPKAKFFWFLFPVHMRLSVNLGSLAFWLMVCVIVVTILKILPYDKWKIFHKFMSLAFILATLHFLLSVHRLGRGAGSLALLLIPMGFGLFGILYKQIYLSFFFKPLSYVVEEVSRVTDNAVIMTFRPEGEPLRFFPGQYAFFSFEGKLPQEQHPFTMCSLQGSAFSILVKARGDFTRMLYTAAAPGMRARVEGPYGRFDYRQGGKDQIWIAGGVGIAPFLAWSESLDKWAGKCVLYYCVHRIGDAVAANTLSKVEAENPNFAFHLFCSEKGAHLTVSTLFEKEGSLEQKEIFMCGPRRLTHAFVKELEQSGVKRRHIHFEDFEFF